MATTHRLKTLPAYFDAVERGDKTFELRVNDRGFQAGDTLVLMRYEPPVMGAPPRMLPPDAAAQEYRTLTRTVSYVLPGGQWGLDPAYCVLGLAYTAAQVLPPPAGMERAYDLAARDAARKRELAELAAWRAIGDLFAVGRDAIPPPAFRDLVSQIAARASTFRNGDA